MHDKLREICDMKETIIGWCKTEVGKGMESADCEELGKAVDMVKDLASAEKDIMEACYYSEVIEAMSEYEQSEPYHERMGYRMSRDSKGRFTRGGYWPMELPDYNMMGYTPSMDGRSQSGSSRGSMSSMNHGGYRDGEYYMEQSRYGKPYHDFMQARRHYTETHSDTDKMEMEAHASEHMGATIETLKDIWKDADPSLRRKMKSDLTSLIGEMTV